MTSHANLSDLARLLGHHMAVHCDDGLPGHFGDELLEAFPDETPKTVGSALAELEYDGLVTLSSLIGPRLPRVRTTVALFVACDLAITGHDPVDDSVGLASRLIDNPSLGWNAAQLEAAAGLEHRRFNPAFALLLPRIDSRHIRQVIQPGYPTAGVTLDASDVEALKRYVERGGR